MIRRFFLAVVLSALSLAAAAQALSPAQRATLKTAILADQAISASFTNGDLQGVADYYNVAASPAFRVWRTSVTQDEIMQNGFDWVRVDNLSVGKARIWEWLFDNPMRTIDPSKANVRAGIDEAWKGTAADLAVRAAVYTHCHRAASRFEKVFATGTGSEASPGAFGVDSGGQAIVGPVSYTLFIGL